MLFDRVTVSCREKEQSRLSEKVQDIPELCIVGDGLWDRVQERPGARAAARTVGAFTCTSILDGLRHQPMALDPVKMLIADFHAVTKHLNKGRTHDLGVKRRQLEETSRKLDGLFDAIADGIRTPGLKSKIEDMEIELTGDAPRGVLGAPRATSSPVR